jgi:hypothetical protein
VVVALENRAAPEAVPALAIALHDEEMLVREHAAWALARIDTEAARRALRGREAVEEDAQVREEIGSRSTGDPRTVAPTHDRSGSRTPGEGAARTAASGADRDTHADRARQNLLSLDDARSHCSLCARNVPSFRLAATTFLCIYKENNHTVAGSATKMILQSALTFNDEQ